MTELKLTVLSLRYSSWSMRPWLALRHAGAEFGCETAALGSFRAGLAERRRLGSVAGLFPVLRVGDTAIHESLAICETVAERFPDAGLWPDAPLARARARAFCSEMATGFGAMRSEMSCSLFARVPDFAPSEPARRDIDRVFEIWNECLTASGGPFLFGRASIVDFFFYPVLTRFRTYGVPLNRALERFAETVEALPAVVALVDEARNAPSITIYDDYIRKLGGDPDAER